MDNTVVEQETVLLGLHQLYSGWSFWVCYCMHCVVTSSLAPDLKDKFLLHYWATYLLSFGGGFVTALLIMRPELAPLPFFGSNYEALLWTSTWWLVNYCPFNLTGRLLTSWPSMVIMRVGSNFARSGLIANRVDLAVNLYPGIVAAPIILGTIAGMAGKAMIDLIRQGVVRKNAPSELLVPGFVWRSACLCTLLYYYLVHWEGIITNAEGLALIRTILIVHGILSSLSGWPLDVTQPFAIAASKMSNIPLPVDRGHQPGSMGMEADNDSAASSTKETKKNK